LIEVFRCTGENGDIKIDALPIFNIDRMKSKGAGQLYGTGALGSLLINYRRA